LPEKIERNDKNEALTQEVAEFFKRGNLEPSDKKKVLRWADYFLKKSEKK